MTKKSQTLDTYRLMTNFQSCCQLLCLFTLKNILTIYIIMV